MHVYFTELSLARWVNSTLARGSGWFQILTEDKQRPQSEDVPCRVTNSKVDVGDRDDRGMEPFLGSLNHCHQAVAKCHRLSSRYHVLPNL